MYRFSKRHDAGSRRKGTVLPLVAVSATVLLSFVALAVDTGYLYVAVAESQRAADASALAGASVLHESDELIAIEDLATTSAADILAMNPVVRKAVTDDAVIEVGHWEGVSRTFTSTVVDRTVKPNAVRVVAPRRNIGLFFASIMGHDEADVSREAIAATYSGKCAGIWGMEGIRANGNIRTDSYDSNEGPYGSGNIYPNGDLCSCQDVRISGDVVVNGDVMYGSGYSYRKDGSSGAIYGVVTDTSCSTVTTNTDFDWAMFNNDNASIGMTARGSDPFDGDEGYHLRLTSKDSITLPGGTYFFDSVRLSGQAKIIVTGPTVIYVAGDGMFTGGGIVNSTGDPANLRIYSEGSTLSLKGATGFYGAVYAPYTDVVLTGTPDYYGALVGQTVDIQGDTRIHVDEKLVEDLFGLEPTKPVLVK